MKKSSNSAIKDQIKKIKIIDEKQRSEVQSCIDFLAKFPDCDIYTRDNIMGHVTSSAWVTNKKRDKVLMVYHNIYDSFCWAGGHNDGDIDSLHVAIKEVSEETGLKESDLKVLNNGNPIDIAMLCVYPHEKRGKWIAPHLHLNLTYAFEADEKLSIRKLDSENSDVKWLKISDLNKVVKEEHMKHIYDRIIKQLSGIVK
jgi:8-oxo-dGTP pyrophosphatase MutT (NUDIX family)